MRSHITAAVGWFIICGCRSAARDPGFDATPVAAVQASPTSGPQEATHQADANPQDPGLLSALERVINARGLPAKQAVPLKTLSREQLLAHLQHKIAKELPPGVLMYQGEALRALGVLPNDYNFEQGLLELLKGQVAGFYDPTERSMFLLDDLSESTRQETLNHELVHALQDQHFDLGSRLKYRVGEGDASSASQALIEGDATSAMFDLMQGPGVTAQLDKSQLRKAFALSAMFSQAGAQAPPVLKSLLISSYVEGFAFVQLLRQRDNWAAVDAAFGTPPRTTEQLLHLDKYDRREPAVAVVEPRAGLPEGFEVVYFDSLGELGLRIVLEEWVPRADAERAAAGWGGDRYVVAQQSGSPATFAAAFSIVMDSVDDASELERLLRTNFTTACTERPKLGPFAIRRYDRNVFITAGPYTLGLTQPVEGASCRMTTRWLGALHKVARNK